MVLGPDFSPRRLSMGYFHHEGSFHFHHEGSPLTSSGHLSPLLGVVEAVGVAPEGAQLIASGLSTEVTETVLQSRGPSMRKLYALKLRLRMRRPASLIQLTARLVQCWSSCRPVSHRVSPLHPEGLLGGYSGLPRPSWWPFSRQTPLVTRFFLCAEAREAWWIRMLSYNLESSDLPSSLGAKAHSTHSKVWRPPRLFCYCNVTGWSTPLTFVRLLTKICKPLLALLFSCHSCVLPH